MSGIRVGLVGTSWWAEAMYLPALGEVPLAEGRITALCGADPAHTEEVARRWGIERATTDWRELVESVDAVIVATPNDLHEEVATAAMQAGRHVLCEKPLALDAAGARRLADLAAAARVTTMTPFTYRWMPAFRWVKQLVDGGYIGRPYHLNLRYHTGYARGGEYAWRFDGTRSGSGVVGDLGSHWLHVARWWFGEVSGIAAFTDRLVPRAARPDGTPYESSEDAALLTLRFANGAHGLLQVSAVAWEGDGFGQTHTAELHGSEGTLHVACDWDRVQEVRGLRAGDGGRALPLPIPDEVWGGARRDRVHDTYRDVFRRGDSLARTWVRAAAHGETCEPDLAEGARVQTLTDAALLSAQSGSVLREV